MSKHLIDFIGISKSYDSNLVLDDLNLYIRENEFLTLLGRPDAEKLQPCVCWEALKAQTRDRFCLTDRISQLLQPMNGN